MKKLISYFVVFTIFYWVIVFAEKLSLPSIDIPIDSIVVYKKDHILYLYGNHKEITSFDVAIGKASIGKKEFEGDQKTPEGSYFIDSKNPNSSYYKNLGISYPNKEDIRWAKNHGRSPGGLIKIHGLKNGLGWIGPFYVFFNWTNGCIAVTNTQMDYLYRNVAVHTPIIIYP